MNREQMVGLRRELLRRLMVWFALILTFTLSGIMAFQLRWDFSLPAPQVRCLKFALIVWIVVKAITFRAARLDRGMWRYLFMGDLVRIFLANVVATLGSFVVFTVARSPAVPRSVLILDLIFSLVGTSALRVVARFTLDTANLARKSTDRAKRTLIYGAGNAGISLFREIRNNPKLSYSVVGFLDDRQDKKGIRIADVQVLGGREQIRTFVEKFDIETILIAIPSATGDEMTSILAACHAVDVECKTIPGLGEMIENRAFVGQVRDVAMDDLLGRVAVHLEIDQIQGKIKDRVVMVTGAAGSIGSDLCRQLAEYHPTAIIGVDSAESPLFQIDREMRERFSHVAFYAEIGNIQNRARLNDLLSQYRPAAIYHAAAYKHVPLMEAHLFEAIENNVFGTYNLATAAAEYGVDDFLLISSDKAVRPTNVMGATKRLAELILLALQNGCTSYVAVRFGNVLGSNGSVIPIFRQQIAAGGPVTVTHPEMRRFFMTIPEACQLVLQAMAIGKGGQICVLDMGQPVKIVDLARKLILLSGLRPEEDIKIEFTGMRPGEKLFEELSTLLEDTIPSAHEKIRIFVGNGVPEVDVHAWVSDLREICERRDVGRLVVALKELVPDYSPSADLLRRMIQLNSICDTAQATIA